MNIPVIGCCIDKISDRVGDFLINGALREAGYLFNFKKNVAHLEDNLNDLKAALSEVQKVEEIDRNNARNVDPDASKWLDGAGKMKIDLEGFLEDKIQNKAHGVCCKVPFPNCYNRFKLSRKASKKSVDVAELIKKGEPFKKRDDEVAHLAPHEDSRLLSVEKCVKFDSRSKIFDDILVALRDSNVTRVGIHGMPGVGKTTMMEEIRRALVLNKEFEEVAVAVVSATLDVKSIQRKLASGLGLSDLDKKDDESTRAGLLRRRLKNGKKILIILDDVWCKLPLADIGIDFGDSKNCKIFMTSRERRVCEANKCMSFLIDILSKEEAWSLFREHAGNCVDYPDISPVSEVVFNECGRLPLIIRAVGEALKDGDLFEWKDAQRQFESCTPHMIANIDDQAYKTLELSFNKLKPEEAKSCLLLCSLFPEDAMIPIDEVSLLAKAMGFLPNTDSIEDARNRALSLAKTLKTSCLLQECEDGNSVKLHDVIRDVSVYVASEDVRYRFMVKSGVSAWPEIHEARRAISLRIETTLELPRKLECPQLQTLMLNSNKYACTRVPDTFFDGLENLAVLSLRNIYISLLLILPNLLMLYVCTDFHLGFDISMLKELKKLEILILACSYIPELPLDLRELKNLRLLDLRGCNQLGFIEEGVLSSLNRLEELYLPSSFDGWNAALLNELNSLTRLTALGARAIDFDNLPGYQFCKKLIRYDIYVGSEDSTYKATAGFSQPNSSTRTIKVGDIKPLIDRRDAAKVLIEGAEKLILTLNKTVKNLFYESSRDGFPHLKSLGVTDCEGMEYLVKWTPLFQKRSFSKLELLVVSGCKIRYLFNVPMVKELKHLKHLEIRNCDFIDAVVGNESRGEEEESMDPVHFQTLNYIKLELLPKLTSFYCEATKRSGMVPAHAQILFPGGKVAFPALERIEIAGLPQIEALWDSQCPTAESFSQLRDLHVSSCERLKIVTMLPRLTNLQVITVYHCGSITEFACPAALELIPTKITTLLPELKKMYLLNLPKLKQTVFNSKELEDEIVVSPKLTCLNIIVCHSLKNVFSPSVAKNLKNLEELMVCQCNKMEEIVATRRKGREESDDKISFCQLKRIVFEDMKNLKKLWGSEYEEHHDEEIQEVDPAITQPQPFHRNEVCLPSLEELRLHRVGISPLEISHSAESFCKLRFVYLAACDALFPPNFWVQMQNLQEFTLRGCDVARELFDLQGLNVRELHVPLLSRMSTFSISRLPELQLLWNRDPRGILDFQSLTVIVIEHCGLLKMLFSCSVARALEQLRVLIVGSCPMIETIVYDDEGKEGTGHSIEFPRLKFIKLEELPRLTSFCNAKIALTMYSLTASGLHKCPRILRFSSGQLHMPQMKISSGQLASQKRMRYSGRARSPWITVTDLNKQLQELATDQDSSGKWIEMNVVNNFLAELAQDDRDEIRNHDIVPYANHHDTASVTSILLIQQSSMIGSSK